MTMTKREALDRALLLANECNMLLSLILTVPEGYDIDGRESGPTDQVDSSTDRLPLIAVGDLQPVREVGLPAGARPATRRANTAERRREAITKTLEKHYAFKVTDDEAASLDASLRYYGYGVTPSEGNGHE